MEKKNASRKARRAARARKQRNRRIALTLCLLLVVCAASIGGTLAWLTDKTDSVTNTFTTAGIKISLTEDMNTDTNNDGTNDVWTAQLIPGKNYDKNPVVSVDSTVTDVDVYLFVKMEETGNPKAYLTFTDNLNAEGSGWTKLTGVADVDNVWYRVVKVGDTTKSWHLIGDDKVTVKTNIVKNGATAGEGQVAMPAAGTQINLTYTAYAIQTEGFETVQAAWAEIGN